MERKKDEAALVESRALEAAQRYTETVSLPPEAKTSVLNMVRNHFGLVDLVERQLKLPADERRKMVSIKQGRVITDTKLKEIDDFVKHNCVPYNCLYVTDDGTIAIRAAGWRIKCQADPRCLKGFENVTHKVEDLNGTIVYTYEGDLVFWTGERYHATGSASTDEARASRTPMAHLRMIAETRMHTRAMRLAIGLPYEIAEDVVEAEEGKALPFPEVPPVSGELRSVADLLARAWRELGMKRGDILQILSINSLGEITDLDEAWEKLERHKGEPPWNSD